MKTPKSLEAHSPDYESDAWKEYSIEELGQWVHLLVKRAEQRRNPEKRKKDLHDARNYLAMIESHIEDAEAAS